MAERVFIMKRNVLKKAIMSLASVAMLAGMIFAGPTTEASAATTKTIYIELPSDSEYETVALDFWKWQGITATTNINTGAFTGWNPGPAVCEKVAGTLYSVTITISPDSFIETENGISVYMGYTDTSTGDKREVDPTYNDKEHWPAVKEALFSEDDAMCLKVDITNWTIESVEVPDYANHQQAETDTSYSADVETIGDEFETIADGSTTTAASTDDGDDSNMVMIIIVVIVVIVVVAIALFVVTSKKKVRFDDDDDDDDVEI